VYFQLIQNGKTTINTGPNGIQRLDKVFELAEKHGLFLQLVLTNNWNPKRDSYSVQNPRNYLSNDYGGMDAYVRQFCENPTHDQFYTKPAILDAFKNYVTFIANRYKDKTNLFGWEIANDARCFSTIGASPTCESRTITAWTQQLAQTVLKADSNHLVTGGNGGFLCGDCPKLFPRTPPPPPPAPPAPAPSRGPGQIRKRYNPLSSANVLGAKKRSASIAQPGGVRIRGRWGSPAANAKRQNSESLNSAFDGSQGVDSEDIANIPEISFSTFQYFPDQNSYAPQGSGSPTSFNDALKQGIDWIQMQAARVGSNNKPLALSAFGLVTQNEEPFFVPFNETRPDNQPVPQRPASFKRDLPQAPDNTQFNNAFSALIGASVQNALAGILQYQIGLGGLQSAPGTPIIPVTTSNGQSTAVNQNGVSPDDGYALPIGPNGDQQVFQNGALQFGAN
jgi:mannan endo-1,4-beta-mannosidase